MEQAPPIRMSTEDPDFDWKVGRRVQILLDGLPIENSPARVVSYDCEAGTIVRAKLDAYGNILVDREKGEFVYETIRGTVSVRWREEL